MLVELLQWLTTPCSPAARQLGYLSEAIAQRSRHRRLRQAWEPHLDASRRIVHEAIDACPSRRRAVVLGSGLLLDIPLAELAAAFEQVDLLDMVHLRPVRRLAARHANVALREADIAGLADALLAGAMPHSAGPPPALAADTDLVISANLLSQLPDLPCRWLAKSGRTGTAELAALGRDILIAHIEWLASLSATVCLISETERISVDRTGAPLATWDALFGVVLPPADAVWSWDIAPPGAAPRDQAYRNTVSGIRDLSAAAARAGKPAI